VRYRPRPVRRRLAPGPPARQLPAHQRARNATRQSRCYSHVLAVAVSEPLCPDPGGVNVGAVRARPWLKRRSQVSPNPHVTCWRELPRLVRTYSTSSSRGRLTSPKHVRRGEVVPATTLADLDHIHPEFAVFGSHLHQFSGFLNSSRILSEFIPVHIGNVCDVRLTADRAALIGGLAVVFGRAQQVRVRVAGIRHRGVARAYGRERGAPGKRVIHHGSSNGYACHAPQGTSGKPRHRYLFATWRPPAGEQPVARRGTVAYAEDR
jgi:hypothetical protein